VATQKRTNVCQVPKRDESRRALCKRGLAGRVVPGVTSGSISPAASRAGSPYAARADDVLAVVRKLEDWGRVRDWRGSDPYDGLTARRLPAPLARNGMARRLVQQLVKRCPMDLRPALGIPADENAAALAWVVSSYALGGFRDDALERTRLSELLARLEHLRAPDFPEPSWGYHWPFASRVFHKPAHAPNTIATTYAGIALLDAWERTGDPGLLETALQAGWFFVRHVPQTAGPGGAYFGYWPGDRTPVHNANLHVCGLLARLYAASGEAEFLTRARRGVGFALAHQRTDGAWRYGEWPNLGWVDNFHTGYVLDSLRMCLDAGIEPDAVGPALDRCMEHYRRELFLEDGTPKYFDDGVYPIDSQCMAQAIQTFAIGADRDRTLLGDALRTFDWSCRWMRRADGAFMFQRRPRWVNPAAHMRGTVTSMLLACVHLLRALRRDEEALVAGDATVAA
jgi:hypothetical protein